MEDEATFPEEGSAQLREAKKRTEQAHAHAENYRDQQQRRAQAVLDILAKDVLQAAGTGSLAQSISAWRAELDASIAANLDSRSIGHFMQLVHAGTESSRKAAAAFIRHAEHYGCRADVYAWMDANYKEGLALDEAATIIISKKLVPLKWRTVRDYITDWVKLRSASTP